MNFRGNATALETTPMPPNIERKLAISTWLMAPIVGVRIKYRTIKTANPISRLATVLIQAEKPKDPDYQKLKSQPSKTPEPICQKQQRF